MKVLAERCKEKNSAQDFIKLQSMSWRSILKNAKICVCMCVCKRSSMPETLGIEMWN